MSTSKIDICNIALASLGADGIRSFDEENKRSRMCDVFFSYTRDFLLAKFDWTFARKLVGLQEVVLDSPLPTGVYVYQLPNDCESVRDLHPMGNRESFWIMQDHLYCYVPATTGIYIYYTFKQTDTSKYSSTFSNLIAMGMSYRMCPSITQDKKLTKALYEQFKTELPEITEVDANIGNLQPTHDNNPNFDSFVNPDFTGIGTGFDDASNT